MATDPSPTAAGSRLRLILLTSLAMLAFAANSVLCRLALAETPLDAASFTTVRIASGALMLALLVGYRQRALPRQGNWLSALALLGYAAGFSFAYISLTAATGALILFGAVQATMIGFGLWRGETLSALQWLGVAMALGGLTGLLLPGVSAPPLGAALLMLFAGVCWGAYSLRGRTGGAPLAQTAGNFVRATPVAVLLSLVMLSDLELDPLGVFYGVLSGAIASGMGYALWYQALPALRASQAATIQLSVPVITAVGGVLLLAEPLGLRLVLASLAILGGIALVIRVKAKAAG